MYKTSQSAPTDPAQPRHACHGIGFKAVVDAPRLATHETVRHGTPDSAIGGVVSVVAQNEVLSRRHDYGPPGLRNRTGPLCRQLHPWLSLRDAIAQQRVSLHPESVTWQSHHAFDECHVGFGRPVEDQQFIQSRAAPARESQVPEGQPRSKREFIYKYEVTLL